MPSPAEIEALKAKQIRELGKPFHDRADIIRDVQGSFARSRFTPNILTPTGRLIRRFETQARKEEAKAAELLDAFYAMPDSSDVIRFNEIITRRLQEDQSREFGFLMYDIQHLLERTPAERFEAFRFRIDSPQRQTRDQYLCSVFDAVSLVLASDSSHPLEFTIPLSTQNASFGFTQGKEMKFNSQTALALLGLPTTTPEGTVQQLDGFDINIQLLTIPAPKSSKSTEVYENIPHRALRIFKNLQHHYPSLNFGFQRDY